MCRSRANSIRNIAKPRRSRHALPLGFSRGLGQYLEHYEYGCTEQLISKAFPSLVSDDLMQQGLPHSEVAQKVAEILDVAASRQSDDGAFGLWCAQSGLHFDPPSAWVVQFMTEAKEQGYDVPQDMFSRGLDHLQQDANGTCRRFLAGAHAGPSRFICSRVTASLSPMRSSTTAHWFEENAKKDWNDDIAAVFDASTYALLKNQDEADRLLNRFHLRRARRPHLSLVGRLRRRARPQRPVHLPPLLHFPERVKTISGDDLRALADPIMGGEYTTISSARAHSRPRRLRPHDEGQGHAPAASASTSSPAVS